MRRLPSLALTALTIATLAACGSASSNNASESSGDSVVTTGPLADVTARIIGDGSSFSLQEVVTETPVVFWFWAPG